MQKRKHFKKPALFLCAFLALALVAFCTYTLRPSNRSGTVQAAAETSAQSPQQNAQSILILNYHKIDTLMHSLSVNPADFRWQMEYLKNHGYNTITPDDLIANMEEGKPLPDNPVLITFDDGYLDNYKNAYPVLKELGMKATIFVVTDFMGGKKGYLDWSKCREMEKHGITIASHTVDHKSMTDLTDEQLKHELVDSKKAAEEALGHSVDYIAYPTGAYNLHIADMTKEAGYKAAFTIKYGNADKESNVYAIERVPVFHTENTNRDFVERISYTPLFQQFGWKKS